MALETQNIPISLGQGLDTKNDPKQLMPGKLTVLQNGVFQTGKEIKKRNGYQVLSANISGGGAITSGIGLSSYNNELTELTGSNLYSYSASGTNWVNKGSCPGLLLSTQTVVRNTTQQTLQDVAVNGSLRCFTWKDASAGIQYSVFDSTTNQSIVNAGLVSASASTAKVMSVGTKFVIFYTDTGTTLKYKSIDTSTPTTLSSSTTIASDVNASKLFDVCLLGTNLGLAYDNATNGVTLYTLSSVLVLSAATTVATDHGLEALTIFADSVSTRYWVAFSNSSHVVKYFVRSSTLTLVLAVTTVETAAATLKNITGVASSGSGSIYYELSATLTYNELTRTSNLTDAGVASGTASFLRSVGLASKAFTYSGSNYLMISFSSPLQPTYFLVNGSGLIVLKLSSGNGGGLTSSPILPEVISLSTGVYLTASLIKDLLAAVSGSVFTQTGVVSATMTFTSSQPPAFVLGNNLHFGGAILNMYDGASVVEHGFNVYPEALTTSATQSNGGLGPGSSSQTINQYQYCAVYEWTDNQGQLHRSAPSVPATVSIPSFNIVEFTATVTHSSAALTTASTTTGLSLGMYVYINATSAFPPPFTNFPGGATITAISGTTVTISTILSAGWSDGTYSLFASNSPLNLLKLGVSVGNTVGFLSDSISTPQVGQTIRGVGTNATAIPSGTTLTAYDSGTGSFTLSSAAIADVTSQKVCYTLDTYSVSVVVPTLRLTQKQNVSIALYRTEINGTVFYRATSPTSLTYNDKTVDSVTIVDAVADGLLIGNEQLYTTGGELENIACPAIRAATTYKSRALVIPAESVNSWGYSKQVIPGVPVEFNDSFINNVDSKIGELDAIGVLDEKIILFGKDSKYFVVGDGPAASGLNNDFSSAQHITGSTGCTNQASIIEVPVGLIYQDPSKGIYLLDRSLSEVYIGADVEQYNANTVTSTQTIPGTNSVRFTLNTGTVLIYDWFCGQWGGDPYPAAAISSALFQNIFTYVQANGLVLQETVGTYLDTAAFIPLSLTTGWMSFAGVEGFQRVRRLLILGNYKSPHTLVVNIYTDFNDTTPSQTVSIPVLSDPGVYQFRIHLSKQKCESIKIQIADSQSSNYGEGYSLSAMAFEVGVKRGAFKLPADKSF